MSGNLKKLYIEAYTKDDYQEPIKELVFTTYVNPEAYSIKYATKQNEEQAAGTSASSASFSKILPQELDLEFVLDRTGAVYGTNDTSGKFKPDQDKNKTGIADTGVMADIDKFKKVVYEVKGEEHRPNFLMIVWGALIFKCVLAEMDITFKLFKPDGAPIRAVIKAKFKGSIEDELRVAKENMKSPDLTHIRIVQDGDKLPLMAHTIYGDSKYYLEVARANGLTNFRKLQTGQKLFFPPIKKFKN